MNKQSVTNEVAASGGMMEVTLQKLRDELGYKRLGCYVLAEIAEELEEAGLGNFPLEVLDPAKNAMPRQTQRVWLYLKDGSPRARAIEAILSPSPERDPRLALAPLTKDVSGLTSDQKLSRIRQLVAN